MIPRFIICFFFNFFFMMTGSAFHNKNSYPCKTFPLWIFTSSTILHELVNPWFFKKGTEKSADGDTLCTIYLNLSVLKPLKILHLLEANIVYKTYIVLAWVRFRSEDGGGGTTMHFNVLPEYKPFLYTFFVDLFLSS